MNRRNVAAAVLLILVFVFAGGCTGKDRLRGLDASDMVGLALAELDNAENYSFAVSSEINAVIPVSGEEMKILMEGSGVCFAEPFEAEFTIESSYANVRSLKSDYKIREKEGRVDVFRRNEDGDWSFQGTFTEEEFFVSGGLGSMLRSSTALMEHMTSAEIIREHAEYDEGDYAEIKVYFSPGMFYPVIDDMPFAGVDTSEGVLMPVLNSMEDISGEVVINRQTLDIRSFIMDLHGFAGDFGAVMKERGLILDDEEQLFSSMDIEVSYSAGNWGKAEKIVFPGSKE